MNITKSEEIKAELQRNFQRGKSTTVCYGYKKWNEGQRTEEIQPTLPARGATAKVYRDDRRLLAPLYKNFSFKHICPLKTEV